MKITHPICYNPLKYKRHQKMMSFTIEFLEEVVLMEINNCIYIRLTAYSTSQLIVC